MKKFLLATLALLSASFSNAEKLSDVTDIDDLTLIYTGAYFRADWNEDDLLPHVMHTYPDGKKSWLFDGFLMLEYVIYNNRGQDVSLGEYNGYAAQRTDWEKLLKIQIGAESGNVVTALDRLIGKLIPELGEPGHKHKVVMGVPVAEKKSARMWGKLNNVTLNFETVDDRVKAMCWYIDQLLETWENQGFKNIDLDGIYWVKETFDDDNPMMVKRVNEYCHKKGLKTYWIPYYNAKRDMWQEINMDVAYLQPNYYFNFNIPISQLDNAIDESIDSDLFLEMEFNEKSVVATSPQPEFRQRMIDYIDHFEDAGVFDDTPIAYYSNDLGINEFKKSDNEFDRDLINRLATIINRRHIMTGWDKAPRAGINDVEVDQEADYRFAYAVSGGIFVDNHSGKNVEIYSADGKCLSVVGAEESHFGYTVSCQPGIYIVKAGARSIKIAVK